MASRIVYNIPLELIEKYRGRKVIVRTAEPVLVGALTEADIEDLQYVQVLTLDADLGVFGNWGLGIPVDFVMTQPDAEFSKLYELGKLLDKRPVRVSITVRPGLAKAVKIAGSLGIASKLIVGQPDVEGLQEMLESLERFLHQPNETQPVEFYQSTLLSFLNNYDLDIWTIQERDPSRYRFVSHTGEEHALEETGIEVSTEAVFAELLREGRECISCEFAMHCKGYFKLPDRDYVCDGGVKEVFRRLKAAASELRMDLAAFQASVGGHVL